MNPTIVNFIFRLFFFTGAAFGLHILVLNYLELPLFDNEIVLTYMVNVLFALIIFILLFWLKDKMKNQIGFIYIFASAFKFLLFFALFYESFMADSQFSKIEFFTLFIPYIVVLVIEVFSLSLWLNKLK